LVEEARKMNQKRLWVSLVILGGLALYIGTYEFYWKVRKTRAEKEAKRVVPFPSEDIQSIALKKGNDGTQIVLQRDGENWKIVSPKAYEADRFEADSLADRLAGLSYTEELKGGKDEDYGLTSPRVSVEVKSKSERSARFDVGNDTPVGFSLYLKKGAQTVLADQGIFRDLDKSVKDFRRKKLFSFMSPDAVSLELVDRVSGKTTTLVKENGSWRLKDPTMYPADRNAVENTLRALEFAEFTDFAAEDADPAALGLNPPLLTATVKVKPGDDDKAGDRNKVTTKPEQIQEAHFGKEEADHWYAARKGSTEIGFLAPDRKKDIFRDPSDYKRKTLADFSEFDATYVKAVLGKETAEFERRGGLGAEKWFLKGTPRQVPFEDMGRVFDFLTGSPFEAASEIKPDPKAFGMDSPKIRIVVKDDSGKVVADATIGEKDGKYYANVKGENIVFAVREDQFRSLESRIRLMKTPAKAEEKKK
jgi:hypothetical protein